MNVWDRVAREKRERLEQRIVELEAENTRLMTHVAKAKHEKRIENARLRALLPGPEVLRAICDLADDAAQMDGDYYAGCAPDIPAVFAWMDKLKGEVNND